MMSDIFLGPTMLSNRLNILANYFFNAKKTIFPPSLLVEPTNHCNLKCPMCPHQKMGRAKGMMTESLYQKILDEASGKTELLSLHFLGESLTHPRMCDFVKYAANKGMKTYLSTNGVLLTPGRAEALFAAGLNYLLIDFDGDSSESYEEIRKNAKYEKVLENIKSAIRIGKAFEGGGGKPTITLQTIIFPGKNPNLEKRFTPDELRNVQIRKKPFLDTFNCEENAINHFRPCYFLWYQMVIAWDGTVPACCVDYDCRNALGNVNDSSLQDIWNSAKIMLLREKHRRVDYQDITMCRSCSIPNSFYFNALFIAASLAVGSNITRRGMALGEKLSHMLGK